MYRCAHKTDGFRQPRCWMACAQLLAFCRANALHSQWLAWRCWYLFLLAASMWQKKGGLTLKSFVVTVHWLFGIADELPVHMTTVIIDTRRAEPEESAKHAVKHNDSILTTRRHSSTIQRSKHGGGSRNNDVPSDVHAFPAAARLPVTALGAHACRRQIALFGHKNAHGQRKKSRPRQLQCQDGRLLCVATTRTLPGRHVDYRCLLMQKHGHVHEAEIESCSADHCAYSNAAAKSRLTDALEKGYPDHLPVLAALHLDDRNCVQWLSRPRRWLLLLPPQPLPPPLPPPPPPPRHFRQHGPIARRSGASMPSSHLHRCHDAPCCRCWSGVRSRVGREIVGFCMLRLAMLHEATYDLLESGGACLRGFYWPGELASDTHSATKRKGAAYAPVCQGGTASPVGGTPCALAWPARKLAAPACGTETPQSTAPAAPAQSQRTHEPGKATLGPQQTAAPGDGAALAASQSIGGR